MHELWTVCLVLMFLSCFGFRRGVYTLFPTRNIITVPFNYRQFTVALESVDMTKSKTYNNMKDIVKKSVTRSSLTVSFFKTAPGEYAEHDKFLGVTNPNIRKIAKDFKNEVSLSEIQWFLESPYNEERFLALVLLVDKYESAAKATKIKGKSKTSEYSCQQLYQFFMSNLKYVNNWNLVDGSAHLIAGPYLMDKDRSVLLDLAKSDDLWERRVSILTTLHFIRQSDFEWTVKLAKILLHDPHDLIHKAVGWMLREAGKKDVKVLRDFLDVHAHEMPRTMLRYSIEKLGAAERSKYLKMDSAVGAEDDGEEEEAEA